MNATHPQVRSDLITLPMLISFSGMDGSGKSTSITDLITSLECAGLHAKFVTFWDDVVVLPRFRAEVTKRVFRGESGTGEPGRPVHRRDKNLRPWYAVLGRTLLYLFDVLRLGRLVRKIRNDDADVIIFDRYIYDQLASLPLERPSLRAYAKFLLRLAPRPDICFLLDADPEAAYRRKPEYPVGFLEQYRRSYLILSNLLRGRMTIIPPLPLEQLRQRIAEGLKRGGIHLVSIPVSKIASA
ncbi:MAG TPA: thymidylate kinase [Terriglobales bacterium]|jgi:thymidylate kinase